MSRRDQDLNDELRAHLELAVRDRVQCGESPEDARANARREFGNELLVKEATRSNWAWLSLERLARDVRYALRQIKRSPGFAAITILTMALGLGATTAMFSLVDGALLRPLQYKNPQDLYLGREILAEGNNPIGSNAPVNARHFHEWRTHCDSCASVAMVDGFGFTLNGERESERVPGLRVSSNFFATLGVQPALGRDFLPEEELPGNHHVLLLSDALWRTRYAADPHILGRSVLVDSEPSTIIGVMPASLSLPRGAQWGPLFAHELTSLVFRPLGMDVATERPIGSHNYVTVVRLKPGTSPQRAVADMNAALEPLRKGAPFNFRARLNPMLEAVTGQASPALWLLMAIVGVVLLIVCVNTGNLMLVRTASRAREAGIRLALGADRGQVFALVFTEALLLVSAGAVIGWIVARSALSALIAAAPAGIPRIEEIQMDWRILLFAAAVAAISTLFCGLVPAWQLARTQPRVTIQSGSRNATDSRNKLRFRECLVGAEIALSTVLLVFGGLLILSFTRLISVDKGFQVEHVLTQGVSLTSPSYRAPKASRAYVDAVLLKLAAIPGVGAVGMTSQLPLTGETWIDGLVDPSAPPPSRGVVGPTANFRFVSPGFFEAMGIPLKRGRFLEAQDRDRSVGVISEKAAERLWPNQDPIGKRVRSSGLGDQPPAGMEVIGVVGSVRTGLDREAPLMVYQPSWTMDHWGPSFVIRTQGDPASVLASVREVIRAQDASVPLTPPKTMEKIMDDSVAVRRYQMYLAAGFAGAALLLASLGIFGVVSFSVTQRTQEMGVRMALGAGVGTVIRMVIGQGMRPVLAGLAVGTLGALALGRYVASQLFGVSPRDPWTIGAVVALLLAVGALACWVPARRASRVDPMVALRCD